MVTRCASGPAHPVMRTAVRQHATGVELEMVCGRRCDAPRRLETPVQDATPESTPHHLLVAAPSAPRRSVHCPLDNALLNGVQQPVDTMSVMT